MQVQDCFMEWLILSHNSRPRFFTYDYNIEMSPSNVCNHRFVCRFVVIESAWVSVMYGRRAESFMEEPDSNQPCEVFLSKHVARNWWVPRRGDLRGRVRWLRFHCPHVVVADMVVHHGGEGWRESQTNRGKEIMITLKVKQQLWRISMHQKWFKSLAKPQKIWTLCVSI